MEVIDTQTAISNFDIQSKSPFYKMSSSLDLQNIGFPRGSESSGFFSMDSPKEASESHSRSGNNGGGFEMPAEKTSLIDDRDSSGSNHALSGGNGACCRSNAAVKVQKVYRSYRTRRRLADSAVVAEELWWQVLDYARLNHSTISFFDYLKPETAASRWNRVLLNASKIGKGLSEDAKAQKLAFQHWIEAIDPRHRYGHNLHIYYEEWCKADAGQPFFYWLDIGDGKDISLKECPRSKLRQQCIKYLGPQEREHYEYIVVGGKIIHKQTSNVLDTIKGLKEGKWIFVMSTSKKLYAGKKKKGMFHHSSFLAGGATLAAGRLVAEHGILKSISAYSGHYRPTDASLQSFLSFLKDNGVNLNAVEIRRATDDFNSYNDGKFGVGIPVEFSTSSVPIEPEIMNGEQNLSSESSETNQTEAKNHYKRTLSGGLQSPRAEVPEKAILQRINSKKAVKSYQLGHQLSNKWSTGAGPRIGCVADYPVELRQQALEFVSLSLRSPHTPLPFPSPRTQHTSSTSSECRCHGGLELTASQQTLNNSNADGISGI